MNDYGGRSSSERGSIQRSQGRQGLAGMFDWDPFRGLFGGNWQHMLGIDVNRREDGFDVEMPVPGFRPEDLDISYQDGVLTVTGRNDRRNFTRSLSVPDDIDEDNIQARVENGMLILSLKQHPKRQPKRIAVSSGSQGMQQVGSQSSTGQTTSGTTTDTEAQVTPS
jgi:HSP20 family molecular chaperone IbpA